MTERTILFNDGAAYDRMMGVWSRLAGAEFLDWLQPATGLRWLDVGCGSGAFTQLVVERCAPEAIDGLDPSEAQLAYARGRSLPSARFHLGDAMAAPFPDDAFDVAVMALVIFFVPDPAKGVAEMARVVRPGGTAASYAWDMQDGGFPLAIMVEELHAMGETPPLPPSVGASAMDALADLWTGAGLHEVETREIRVRRTFTDFEDFWETSRLSSSAGPIIDEMSPDAIERLRARLRERFPADAAGRVTYGARANAVKGRVAG